MSQRPDPKKKPKARELTNEQAARKLFPKRVVDSVKKQLAADDEAEEEVAESFDLSTEDDSKA
jgi:hypothetical protein